MMNMQHLLSVKSITAVAALSATVLFSMFPVISTAETTEAFNECMQQRMDVENDEVTLGQLREKCLSAETVQHDEDEPSAAMGRLGIEDANVLKPFTLIPHRANYILIAAHNSKGFNEEPYRIAANDPTIELDDTEAQFQISIKFPLAVDLFDKEIDIFAAYTNRSFWQVYNGEQSRPFRDTNHEPEVWIQFRPDWNIFGLNNSVNQLGINHQSNGRAINLSRSWNRVFANFVLEQKKLSAQHQTLVPNPGRRGG